MKPKTFLASATCLSFALIACASGPVERNPAREAMRSLVEEGFAGSVLVACGERIVFAGDFGLDVPDGAVPSYWVASISKQFTAVAILRLLEEGRLELDDPLSKFFPEAPAEKSGITLRQLLTHRSGLAQNYAADGEPDRDRAVERILSTPFENPPGERFAYANDNYNLLAAVVEVVSGDSYETYLRALLEGAGLEHVSFWPEPARPGELVPPVVDPLDGPFAEPNWGWRGATGIRVSVPDLHRWLLALRAGEVVTEEHVEALFGPHFTLESGTGIGFGWFRSRSGDGRPMVWTRGQESMGANAVLYLWPRTGLILATATHAGPPETGEGSVTGWSRLARDAMIEIFAGPEGTPCR